MFSGRDSAFDIACAGLSSPTTSCGSSSSPLYNMCSADASTAATAKKSGITMFVLIYVDDIIVTSSLDDAIVALLRDPNENFSIKDLGDLCFFWGIEVAKTQDGLLLTHTKYASDLLTKVDMHGCKSTPTPMSTTDQLSLNY
ncbi:hypothetical protein QYE76_051330 [Lolium multiflorum]|uniref:Reverse transcriptase Ty1/copia-type domain-containing protein n=1 Tax=Lolium multiflorum TaxID=4521 RepID=A0AAD8ST96_LOLMU|nr:hypothetical protein QYE76_051330 [Lolium multiflorum]